MAYASTFTNFKRIYPEFDPSQVSSDGESLTIIRNEDGVPYPNDNLNYVEEEDPNRYDVKILNENQQVVREFIFDNTEYNYNSEELAAAFDNLAYSTEVSKKERIELGRQEILRQQLLQELNPDDLDFFVLVCNNGWTNPRDGSPREIYLSKNSLLHELQEAKEVYEMTFDEVATLNSSTLNNLAEEHEDYFQNHWEYHGLTRPPELVEGTPAPMVE